VLLALAARVDVGVLQTAMVGDTPTDLAMARGAAAGRVIGVESGIGRRDELEPLADAVFRTVGDLIPAGS
jgi:phosphoglycolate phosphatase